MQNILTQGDLGFRALGFRISGLRALRLERFGVKVFGSARWRISVGPVLRIPEMKGGGLGLRVADGAGSLLGPRVWV